MPRLPLGGTGANFDSKKTRGELINMIAESDKDKTYKTIKQCDGLASYATASDAIRSNILTNGGYAYFLSGANVYRMDNSQTVYDLGVVGGSGQGQILANSVPGNNQIVILTGTGLGYIYDNAGLTQITDVDFYSTTSGTVLNERFWFVRDGTNEFFASDISNGFSYNPLSFATAEESPDLSVAIIAKRSSMWVIGEKTMEFWQTFTDVLLPVRKVRGSTIERGIQSRDSLAEVGDYFAFLADDLTVRLVSGSTATTISDLDFNLKVRGNGTPTYPGFTTTDDAIGFFVDTPTHKIYYLTFPTEEYTWGYDLSTGFSHLRKSETYGYWRAQYAAKFDDKIIMGDALTGTMWELIPAYRKEGAELIRFTIRTPGYSSDKDMTIPLVEIDMETAQPDDPNITPNMMVKYTKDGGNKWINHEDVPLGNTGDYAKRVPIRNMGRLVRNKDFSLELTVTQDIRFQVYGADMPQGDSI